jgi:hypothetical protein
MRTLLVHQPQVLDTNVWTAMLLYVMMKKRRGIVENPRRRLQRRRNRHRNRGQRRILQIRPSLRHTPPGKTGCRHNRRGRESRRGCSWGLQYLRPARGQTQSAPRTMRRGRESRRGCNWGLQYLRPARGQTQSVPRTMREHDSDDTHKQEAS